MRASGGCMCGAVRYEVDGPPDRVGICHCRDCRRASGAPMMAWAVFSRDRFRITQGDAKAYNSSPDTFRHFCPDCGTGLYYVNEVVLPGLVDVPVGTLDDPEGFAPAGHIQVAERIGWMASQHELPMFDRYPGAG